MTNARVAPPTAWPSWWLHPMLVGLWLGSFLLAAALEHAPHASLWFPPAAVTFAGLFCLGWRAAPAIVLSPIFGVIADLYGRRLLLALGLIAFGIFGTAMLNLVRADWRYFRHY